MKPTLAVLAAAIVAGCVGDFSIPEEKLPVASTKDLCQSLTAAKTNGKADEAQRVLAELKRRNTFSPNELAAISRGKALPGMSEEAGLCAWGYYWYDLNTTTTAGAVSKQYVFGDGNYMPRTYLYTTNGRVTGTQE